MPRGTDHIFPVRVYYEDTDAAGIVYYANYLKFAERARTELLRIVGISNSEFMATEGLTFAVRHCSADYLKPARLDDELEVCTRINEVLGASIDMNQVIKRDGTDMVRLRLKLACMTMSGRPARIPETLRSALAGNSNREMAILDGK